MNFRDLIFLCVILSQIPICECGLIERGKDRDTRQLYMVESSAWWDQVKAANTFCRGPGRCSRSGFTAHCRKRIDNFPSGPYSDCANCPKWEGIECVFSITVKGLPEPTHAPPPPPPSKHDCFRSTARVSLENGNSLTMSKLRIGDKIQTVSAEGIVTYNEVRAFLNQETTVTTIYQSIKTSLNYTLDLTGRHLIYRRRKSVDKFQAMKVYANQVSIDDEVLIERNDELTATKVVNITQSLMQGAYAPLTEGGNVVVNGILTSCYGIVNHDMAHFAMTPLQWFPQITKLIFGNYNGIVTYVAIAKDLAKMIPFFGANL